MNLKTLHLWRFNGTVEKAINSENRSMNFTVGQRATVPPSINETLERLRRTSTGTLGHLTDFGFAEGLYPLGRPCKAVGLAYTVRLPQVDSTALQYAISDVQPGEILVIDTSGERRRALWGGVVAHAANRANVAGVILDGPTTDWEEVMDSGVPVWCRGTSSLTGRRLGLEGAVLVPVHVGGAGVNPGDVVLADSDGVFIIPLGVAAERSKQMVERDDSEPIVRARLDAGEKLAEITGARAVFAAATQPGKVNNK
jgi:regulator of RNase E activity RraA